MIKNIVLDMDGVIFPSQNIHHDTLNEVLVSIDPKYYISYEDSAAFDSLTTAMKLRILTRERGLPEELHKQIQQSKTLLARKMLIDVAKYNERLSYTLEKLKQNFKLYVASNADRELIMTLLQKAQVIHYFDGIVSRNDVSHPKPNPACYLKACLDAGVGPKETLVFEDSAVGIKAAEDAGCYVVKVTDVEQINLIDILRIVNNINAGQPAIKSRHRLNVLVPAAGLGSRFEREGWDLPKPLIQVLGKPMIEQVVTSFGFNDARYIFVIQGDHDRRFGFSKILKSFKNDCEIVVIEGLTTGAAATCLKAKEFIDSEAPLCIANSDQIINYDTESFLKQMLVDDIDGSIVTFKASEDKWSYVSVNKLGFITDVKEKEVISDTATCGIYGYNKGSDFVKYAEQMIEQDIRFKNEHYVAPVMKLAIDDGKKFTTFNCKEMHSTGTPEDLSNYLKYVNGDK